MSLIDRVGTWDRRTGYVLRIAAGKLFDAVLNRTLVDTSDTFTLSARAYQNDAAVAPTALTGSSAVAWVWSGSAQQWAVELPYDAPNMNGITTVRVVATLTANSITHDLMDAVVKFTKADGR